MFHPINMHNDIDELKIGQSMVDKKLRQLKKSVCWTQMPYIQKTLITMQPLTKSILADLILFLRLFFS